MQRLEHARSLLALGAGLRRANSRAGARAPLREGFDLARECGADGLANAIGEELAATGVRVPERPGAGPDALTASERRIARMAAEGSSNQQIAQELFLTIKTVEMHLSNAYRKLSVRSRRDLAASLRD